MKKQELPINILDVVESVRYHKQGLNVNDLLFYIGEGAYDRQIKKEEQEAEREGYLKRKARYVERIEREKKELLERHAAEVEKTRIIRDWEAERVERARKSRVSPMGDWKWEDEPKIFKAEPVKKSYVDASKDDDDDDIDLPF